MKRARQYWLRRYALEIPGERCVLYIGHATDAAEALGMVSRAFPTLAKRLTVGECKLVARSFPVVR